MIWLKGQLMYWLRDGTLYVLYYRPITVYRSFLPLSFLVTSTGIASCKV